MRKRVYIYAWLAGNLGDDLFVRILCEKYPRTRFYILADEEYKRKYNAITNLVVYSWRENKVEKINKMLKRLGIDNGFHWMMVKFCDAVVHIGGSVYTQHSDDWTEFYNADEFLVKKSRKLYQISGNFGPYSDNNYYKAYHDLFKKYKGICFRDSYSYNLFKDIPTISWAPDVVFQYETQHLKKERKAVIAPVELANRTGKWSLVQYEQAYLDFHVKIIEKLLHDSYQIMMIAFCQCQADGSMMQKILDRLRETEREQIQCIAYGENMDVVIRQFEEAEIVVGTRFHANILGLICNCKVLPIIYDSKTEHVLDDMEYPMRICLSEMDNIDIELYLSRLYAMHPVDVEKWKEKSREQFQYIDKILGE